MKQSEIIRFNEYDQVTSLFAKIDNCTTGRIIVEFHGRSADKITGLHLKLLLRKARKRNSRLAIISKDSTLAKEAALWGIPVFSSSVEAGRNPWRYQRNVERRMKKNLTTDVPLNRNDFEKRMGWVGKKPGRGKNAENGSDSKIEKALQNPVKGSCRLQVENKKIRIIIFSFVFVLLFFVLSFLFSKAMITIQPARQHVTMKLKFHAVSGINSITLTGGIPMQDFNVTVDGEDHIKSSGNLLLEDGYARGEIELVNLTGHPIAVPQGTVVLALGEPVIRFKTLEEAQVPAGVGKTQSVRIEAIEPGSIGNVAAGEIRAFADSTGLYLTVDNPEETMGGTEKISVYPNESDYQQLKEKLILELAERAEEQIREKIGDDMQLIPGSVRLNNILEENRIPDVGEPADFLDVTLKADYSGWIIHKNDINTLTKSVLTANLDEGMTLEEGSLQVETISDTILTEESAEWEVEARVTIRQDIPSDTVYVVLGKPIQEAKRLIQTRYPLSVSPNVTITPWWIRRIPYLTSRIKLVVE